MPEQKVLVSRQDAIAVVTLNRPESLNALDSDLMRALVAELNLVAVDASVRCVVLTGAGKGFCAGGDTRAIAAASRDRVKVVEVETSPDERIEKRIAWVRRSAEASRLLHEMPKPTIAMINGACAGAGLSLAAACDVRLAGASARFRASFTATGVSGDYGGTWLWTHILGTAKARQLYLIDRKRSAEEALAFGLVDEVWEDDQLTGASMDLAARLAALPGEAAAFAKANLNAALTESFAASLDRESRAMILSREALLGKARR